MRNRLLLLCFAVFISSPFINAQKYSFTDAWADEGYDLVASGPESISLMYSIHGFNLDDIEIQGKDMKKVRLPGHFLPGDEGMPDLPGSGRYIAVPQGSKPVLRIISIRKEVVPGVDISPSPRIPKDTEKGPPDYTFNQAVYSRDAFYPAEPFKLSELTQVRGVDAVILGITPFQYNPVTRELIVYRDIEFEVTFEGGNGEFGDERLRSRWWDPLLEDLFVNYSQLPAINYSKKTFAGISKSNSIRETGYEYLIICPNDQAFISWADTIKQFRTMQGILTGVVTTATIGGNTVQDIESYIDNAYLTWDIPPAAILLLGDYGTFGSTIISPIWDNYCVSDHIFADVNNDDEEEIILARMTARNATELEVMIRKAIGYESNPPTNTEYYNRPITALGWQTERWFQICSEVVGGYFRNVRGKDPVRINAVYEGDPSADPWSTATNTATVMEEFGPSGLAYIPATPSELGGWTGGTPGDVNAALNAGSFLIQHRDHGFENGWGEPAYQSGDIPGLTNTDLSFIFSINCLTGKYNYGQECFAEKFHRYTYQGQPAGALGLLAASEVSYSFVNDVYVWGVFDNLFPDFMPDYGTTPESRGMLPAFGNAAGKFFLKYSSWPYNTINKEVTYNLFHHHGDAFTCLFSEVPQELTVLHAPVQIAGAEVFAIQADEYSLITLSVDGEIIGMAEGTGLATDIPIIPQNPPVFIDVVVTKPNHIRYHTKIQVIPPNGPFVITDAYTIMDPLGNNNGKLDYGESVSLNCILKNLGNETAENVTTTITTDDIYTTITDASESAGTIEPGQATEIAGAFSFSVSGNVQNGHYIRFDLQASNGDTTWNSSFHIKAHAPVLEYTGFSVSDEGGNNNGRLDAGETAELTIKIKNKGASDAYQVSGLLSTNDPFMQVLADSVFFGDIAQNATVTKSFPVSSYIITPPGHMADFNVQFSGYLEIGTSGNFSVQVGLFPILILDLDGNHNSGQIIKNTIDDWLIFAEYKDEIPDDLGQYNTIFLCLGTYNQNHVLTQEEAAPFIDFLNNGGNLYIEGADTWYYDQQYNATSLHPMFHIDGLTDGYDDLSSLTGIPGTFTEGMTFLYNGDNDYIDRITAEDPAFDFFGNTNPAYNVAVAYDEGTYKTIGTSFEFGGLMNSGANTRKNLMKRYMNFFGMYPIGEAPQLPAGDTSVCINTPATIYSTTQVSGASYYIWEVDPPTAGTATGWDNVVTVNWTPGYTGPAKIRVSGMNASGLGPVSDDLDITVHALPGATVAYSDTEICAGDTTFVNITLSGVSPWNLVISLGGYPVILNPNKPNIPAIPITPTESIDIQITSLTDGTGCAQTEFESTLISVNPLPSTPAKPTGPENVDLNAGLESAFVTQGSENSDSYEWTLSPAEAGTVIGSEGVGCTVNWEGSYTGQAQLKVKGLNACGAGEFSEILTLNVYNSAGILEQNAGIDISIFPNPSSGNFIIDLKSQEVVKAELKIFSSTGEPVWGAKEIEIQSHLAIQVNSPQFQPGIYMLQAETNKGRSSRKIVIKN